MKRLYKQEKSRSGRKGRYSKQSKDEEKRLSGDKIEEINEEMKGGERMLENKKEKDKIIKKEEEI